MLRCHHDLLKRPSADVKQPPWSYGSQLQRRFSKGMHSSQPEQPSCLWRPAALAITGIAQYYGMSKPAENYNLEKLGRMSASASSIHCLP